VKIEPGNTAFTPLDFYDYPISHSLLTSLGWSVAFAGVYYLVKKYPKGAWVLGIGVFSHWVLDFITHRPDLPLSPGSSEYFGLGLWNSFPGSVIVEGVLFLVGVIIYVRTTTPKDRIGNYAFWSLVGFLALVWVVNMVGPPPPGVSAIGWSAMLLWLLVPWGYWIDRHRAVRALPSGAAS
jgi:hypothetical protein